jgi:S-(hydroxymethyl)glutathione dehydrogenase / alcohol dehydrogenase
MKAAVCYTFGDPVTVEEITIEEPKRGEVKVRIAAVAICHSDLHLLRGDWGPQLPVVAGHEAAGIVAEVGPDVTTVKPGDRVVVSLMRSCGRCFYCARGQGYLCDGAIALNAESRLRDAAGRSLVHGISTAAFAEEAVVHESQVIPLPAEMPLQQASLLACGVLTGTGAVWNTAKVAAGSSVVVLGCGGVGLNAVQAAAIAGASRIIALDTAEVKLAAAQTFGATDGIHVTEDGKALRRAVRDLTNGRGADYVLVTVGHTGAVDQGIRLLRRGGTIVIAGLPAWTAKAPMPMADFAWDGQIMLGSHLGSANPRTDIPRLVDFYLAGRLKLDELITARYPLEHINDALAASARGDALRNLIVLDPSLA